MGVQGFGVRVQVSGFWGKGLWFGVWGLGLNVREERLSSALPEGPHPVVQTHPCGAVCRSVRGKITHGRVNFMRTPPQIYSTMSNFALIKLKWDGPHSASPGVARCGPGTRVWVEGLECNVGKKRLSSALPEGPCPVVETHPCRGENILNKLTNKVD